MAQTIVSGYVNRIMSDKTLGNMREKIVRIYNEDKKALNREKMIEYLTNVMDRKKGNSNIRIRLYTDRGWISVKGLQSDNINWDDEEEYLKNRKDGSGKAFKEVYFVDFYLNSNI
jgi:hypothetical protein